jgi:hypothetical protein
MNVVEVSLLAYADCGGGLWFEKKHYGMEGMIL